ncbi:hypothetical protein JCM33374_g3337 [Metschnikowia sp. JCM 33374]|nr:hypothetical protein JCM33374_g3337 [Metschnikowia sp. JCM 33374]
MSSEISPLLPPPAENDPEEPPLCLDDACSKFTLESRALRRFCRRRFWWLCVLGVLAFITLQLSFLPRTSPSRDFRRWHSLRFTRTDVKRVFLVQSEIGVPGVDGKSVEQNLREWLKSLGAARGKAAPIVASGTPQASALATFVESSMRSLRFSTSAHTYAISEKARVPISSSLQLVDSHSSRVLYTAPVTEPDTNTPSYYLFGKNGSVRASYVFCHSGTPEDFHLLHQNAVSLRDKIAILSHPLSSEYALHDKIKLAEKAGCAGVVVYGDKDADVAISRNYKPGFPTTPEFRLPVSYNAIIPILNTLGPSPAEFPNWSYGPNNTDASLELVLATEFSETPLHATNIVATIDGVLHDGEIVIGSARDVLTSSNPMSGHAIMLEVMRRLSHLRSMGWKPLRRIRFVSWDASRSGALGSLEMVKDRDVFRKNLPILAYINLDEDAVTGSHFSAASSPLFNHLLRNTADQIPFPKGSHYYKRLHKDFTEKFARNDSTTEEYYDDNGHNDDNEVSLLQYWFKQDSGFINNKLGYTFAAKDSATFQLQMDTPVINLGFKPSAKFNDTLYVPESESYSTKWVTEEVDPNLDLHASLVRLLGLLVLSLGEHEVVDSRFHPYVRKAREFLEEVKETNKGLVDAWSNATLSFDFLKKSSLYYDIQEEKNTVEGPVSFNDVLYQFDRLLNQTEKQAHIFDKYNQEVEDLWKTDYPWYKMIRKIHIYAKFKVTNYKLLRLEKELGQQVEWLDDQKDEVEEGEHFHHFMYDIPQGIHSILKNEKRGAFAAFYEAFDSHSVEQVVKLAAAKYERLKAVYRRIN